MPRRGKFAEAVSEWQKFESTPGSWSADAKGYGHLVTTALLNDQKQTGYAPASFIASGFAVAGDRENTFLWLNKAVAEQDDQLGGFVRYPLFDGVRSDPRYAAIMHQIGLPE
jgi:hypothetical protein